MKLEYCLVLQNVHKLYKVNLYTIFIIVRICFRIHHSQNFDGLLIYIFFFFPIDWVSNGFIIRSMSNPEVKSKRKLKGYQRKDQSKSGVDYDYHSYHFLLHKAADASRHEISSISLLSSLVSLEQCALFDALKLYFQFPPNVFSSYTVVV